MHSDKTLKENYRGLYGIESSGRDAIKTGKALLKKYLEI